ncbi:twin transmembrane helix small protein [Chitiniphilus purpureus]|uniref:Twin transmembrane helix small protein n=1 Tax=Chitiniphilus purpureus TaxID=2981137 RepID=A0ABY6DNK1_9NEIS|nr:twin transmembrane helix small protein [Chitiniphilus sp. CD1]UXY15950.1 twin transmembrane helix small protein [Chitiniphilus sp. CD1]
MKIVAVILLVVILAVLGRAMLQLVRGPSGSVQLVRSLTWRIALSILLFLMLLVAIWQGWITPHGV